MILTPVTSSNIEAMGFEDGTLQIRFKGGKTFAYTGPKVEAHHQALLAAESIGKYFSAVVRRCPDTVCTPVQIAVPAQLVSVDEILSAQLVKSLA